MAKTTRIEPAKIEIYPDPSGRLNFQVISGGRQGIENILVVSKQGYERTRGVMKAIDALTYAIQDGADIEYLTREQYVQRQQRRRRIAAKRRLSRG